MCYGCGALLAYDYRPGFNDTCDRCGKDLHVCLMCRFYTPGAHWDCRETIEEFVADKERRNHCDFFIISEKYLDKGRTADSKQSDEAKRRFNSLFGE